MMQKRTLYISLLLVSCLLFFGFSYASAQTVTFQSTTAPRCTEVTLNITVENPGDLSALELVFEVSGDYSSMSVDFADGFTGLDNRVGPIVDGNVIRMAALKADAGDGCVDFTGGVVVGEITFITADVCTGTIDLVGTTVTGGCCDGVSAATGLVGCDPIAALATTIIPGSITIVNLPPTITCPGNMTVHWGTLVEADVTFDDPDLTTGCETLSFEVTSGPGSVDAAGHYSWQTDCDDVCDHTVVIKVTDDCGEWAECSFDICVFNIAPEFDEVATVDEYFSVWSTTVDGDFIANDPDGGCNALLYQVVSFDGPTSEGTGLQLDPNTGYFTWDVGSGEDYTGSFTLCAKVSDGADICSPCSPTNADTMCVTINITGFAINIEKVHKQLQGHETTVTIYLDSNWANPIDAIGGFDFLIAYDASALTALGAAPGTLIDTEFEYFTYRFGPFGNCGNGCPSGMMRIVGLRETNNGVINPAPPVVGPGDLVILTFLVTNDRTFECQYAPIKFFWIDCGDNTLSDESGNWLWMGHEVFTFEGALITDTTLFGYSGPFEDCGEMIYTDNDIMGFKNVPLRAIDFRNGGVDIICADSIDDRGDINLNGIENEIADATVLTNYFIYGLSAFTINVEGQIAASDVNADGLALSVADLVYLIRVIVGDALPYAKANPQAFADFKLIGNELTVETNVELGAALFVFNGHVNPTLGSDASHMELISDYDNNTTRVLIYSMNEGASLNDGSILTIEGNAGLVSVETAEYRGTTIANTTSTLVPVAFKLSQNYPNPFNPATAINLDLPKASNWKLSIFNVSGQRVAEFSGFSEAGTVTVTWDAGNLASGMYFYKMQAGEFSATKKMLLIK